MNITEDFRDLRFRAYVREHFCENREWIETRDIEKVTTLHIANRGITDLSGIEHFTLLEELDCNRNELLNLELAANRNLKKVDCGFNRIRHLDLSHNTSLVKLDCYWNLISDLDLQTNSHLQELNCSYNSLFTLHLQHNSRLASIDCGHNYLMDLNIENCHQLIEIRCNHNHLAALNLTGNHALQSVRCFNNHLTSLDLSENGNLVELYCAMNKIFQLDTSHLAKLERLDIANNLIVEPDHVVEGAGVFNYDVSMSSYSACFDFANQELAVFANVSTKRQMEQLSPIIHKAWAQIDQLHERALKLIASIHPDENVAELAFSELSFDDGSSFRLGYDAGDTPAGQLFIYVRFNEELEPDRQLIYETF